MHAVKQISGSQNQTASTWRAMIGPKLRFVYVALSQPVNFDWAQQIAHRTPHPFNVTSLQQSAGQALHNSNTVWRLNNTKTAIDFAGTFVFLLVDLFAKTSSQVGLAIIACLKVVQFALHLLGINRKLDWDVKVRIANFEVVASLLILVLAAFIGFAECKDPCPPHETTIMGRSLFQ